MDHVDSKTFYATDAEPAPVVSKEDVLVWELVIQDMQSRDQFGRRKYGRPLRPFDGRDTLVDAYQEALDLCVYLRKVLYERDGAKE